MSKPVPNSLTHTFTLQNEMQSPLQMQNVAQFLPLNSRAMICTHSTLQIDANNHTIQHTQEVRDQGANPSTHFLLAPQNAQSNQTSLTHTL
jgi:hypothetical protein